MINSSREEKLITRYLLGQATEEECVRIEEGYFHKPEYYEQVLAIEEELISNYVRGSLSAAEQSLFENHFLSSERRRKKYELTKDLATYLSESYTMAPDRPDFRPQRIDRIFGESGALTVRRMVWTMLVIILFSSIGYLLISKGTSDSLTSLVSDPVRDTVGNQSTNRQIASVEPKAVPTTETFSQPQNLQSKPDVPDLIEDSQPYGSVQRQRSRSQPKDASMIPGFIFNLPGLRTSDEPTEIIVPRRIATIQLNLSLDELDYSVYGVAIKTFEGKLVLRRDNLKPRQTRNGRILTLLIPSKILKETDYVLDISGANEPGEMKMLHESSFTVKRP